MHLYMRYICINNKFTIHIGICSLKITAILVLTNLSGRGAVCDFYLFLTYLLKLHENLHCLPIEMWKLIWCRLFIDIYREGQFESIHNSI